MRPLTAAELKLLLERGLEALPDRNAAEVVEALALEVSERRVADVGILREALVVLADLELQSSPIRRGDAPESFWNAIKEARQLAKRAAEAGIGEGS